MLTTGINFINFKKKIKKKTIIKKLNLLINEKNHVVRSLSKEYKDSFKKLEKLIIPLLIKLAKSPEAYIHWPNRAEVIESQLKKIIAITRGK